MNASRVCLSPELTKFIADRIARYGQEAAQNQLWLAPYVERFGVLPLFLGWLETIGIFPDGRVRKFSADGSTAEYEGLREPEGHAEFAMALVEGAKRFPEWSSALLPRPTNAVYAFERESPAELTPAEVREFKKNRQAWKDFESVPPSYRRVITHWVVSAKQPATRARRLDQLMQACAEQRRILK